MELSPLDVRSQKFSRKLKGYDATEVDNFLEIVSKDMEKLYGEYYGLKEELVKRNQEIADYKEKDKSISEAIFMVQSVAGDIKKAAIAEADAIKKVAVSETETLKKAAAAEAEAVIGNANKRYVGLADDIDDLLNKRIVIINSIKNILSTSMDLINRETEKDFGIPHIYQKASESGNASFSGMEETAEEDAGEFTSGNCDTGEEPAGGRDLADFLKSGTAGKTAAMDSAESGGPEKNESNENPRSDSDTGEFSF